MIKYIAIIGATLPSLLSAQIVYEGKEGPGKGKHIVFVTSDHEYRAEETCPALARILAKRHGFKCTVLFGVDKNGVIKPGASNIKGLEALDNADGMFIFTRFLNLPDNQMKHIVDYLDRAGPVVGLRTSSHGFKIPKKSTYAKFDFKYAGKEYEKGFGHQVLGNTWVGHYGRNHKQGTLIQLVPEQKNNPILKGVKDNAFCYAGGYVGKVREGFTVLTKSQPLVSMDPKSKADPKMPPMPSTWTREYTGKNGKKGRVFHSTQGASQDILDPSYRRMIINGVYWSVGLEDKIKANSDIDFVGAYNPSRFGIGTFNKGVKPADLQSYDSPIGKKKATKKTKRPAKDPKLAQYFIGSNSPKPKTAKAIETSLPLKLEKGSRIAFVGNLLLDDERKYGYLETLLQQKLAGQAVTVRNFAWPGDEVDLQPRPSKFGNMDQHLLYYKSDVIFAAFGYNESFAGKAGIAKFEQRIDKFLSSVTSKAYNGKSAPQVVLLSPTADEDIKEVKAATANNANLQLYTAVLKKMAAKHKVAFVDVLTDTNKAFSASTKNFTTNGHALTAEGHQVFAQSAFKGLFGTEAPAVNEELRKLVLEKDYHIKHRYRPLNSFYYTGGRKGAYGYLDFLPAMRNFDLMANNCDVAIHAVAQGKKASPDQSNIPELGQVALGKGANKWMTPADEQKAFKVDPRFEVSCFASEQDFPELACPISIRWDAKGRLWVSCSTTYPHVYPGRKPNDKIIILEDTDKDGKADKCTTFAEGLHIPLSFVLDGKGGVYVSEQPDLVYLQDTDGDDKADHREVVYTGFGVEDSHHSIHDFVWTPGGDLLFRESVFHHSQVETPYGPIRNRESVWYQYHPSTKKLTTFGAYFSTNPWGVAFDNHGNHVASHPVFASSFHSKNPQYPAIQARAHGIQAYSGVCGHDFIYNDAWPKEMRGGFLKVRYKPTNKIEFHTWVKKDDHFAEEEQFDVLFSSNLSFIPVDLQMAPDGSVFVCDWYNPVKGHAQYSLRDPRRDRKSGRIWRIVPKGAKMLTPAKIDTASIDELLAQLESPRYRVRSWAKRELRSRDKAKVLTALDNWVKGKAPKSQLEALWMYQSLDTVKPELLTSVIKSDKELVVASAYGPLRAWCGSMDKSAVLSLLSYGASHPSQHVRREAVICASYVGGEEAVKAILPVLDAKAGVHLRYAINSALNSATLAPFWKSSPEKSQIAAKLKKLAQSQKTQTVARTNQEIFFDATKGLQKVKIGCVPERLQFDTTEFKVKAGKPVKLTFKNPDATKHNLLILDQTTSIQTVGMAANDMARTPGGEKKDYIPNVKGILHHTKLIGEDQQQILRFIAPKKPGKYPFVCTFPGHWTVMKGYMIVE